MDTAGKMECLCPKCRTGLRENGEVMGSFVDCRTFNQHNRRKCRSDPSSSQPATGSKRSGDELESEDGKRRKEERECTPVRYSRNIVARPMYI